MMIARELRSAVDEMEATSIYWEFVGDDLGMAAAVLEANEGR